MLVFSQKDDDELISPPPIWQAPPCPWTLVMLTFVSPSLSSYCVQMEFERPQRPLRLSSADCLDSTSWCRCGCQARTPWCDNVTFNCSFVHLNHQGITNWHQPEIGDRPYSFIYAVWERFLADEKHRLIRQMVHVGSECVECVMHQS